MLIELNKEVKDRFPIVISKKQNLDQINLTAIGHQLGLPMKVASGAKVYDEDESHFYTNSDIAGETKGTMLINSSTGVLEAFLLGGSKNFTQRDNESCLRSNQKDDSDANEFAMKTYFLKEILKNF